MEREYVLAVEYFQFLCDIIPYRSDDYTSLLEYLHSVEFYSLIPNDDNRVGDGKRLRDIFKDERAPTGPLVFANFERDGCSVLEMMIGLSFRIEYELLGSLYERSVGDWFWILVDNLCLGWATNEELILPYNREELEDRVKNLVERKYSSDGGGGLFPLTNSKKDQRRVELWYQMSYWIIENFPI